MKLVSAALALGVVVCTACNDAAGPTTGTITVEGVVVDEFLHPRRAEIVIPGHPLTVSDANGRFRVRGVKPPYDLLTLLPSEYAMLVYAGLTRPDPLIVVPAGPSSTFPNSASVRGAFFNMPRHPWPVVNSVAVVLEAAEGSWRGSLEQPGYVLAPRWSSG